jgi:hypothetical protein
MFEKKTNKPKVQPLTLYLQWNSNLQNIVGVLVIPTTHANKNMMNTNN